MIFNCKLNLISYSLPYGTALYVPTELSSDYIISIISQKNPNCRGLQGQSTSHKEDAKEKRTLKNRAILIVIDLVLQTTKNVSTWKS